MTCPIAHIERFLRKDRLLTPSQSGGDTTSALRRYEPAPTLL